MKKLITCIVLIFIAGCSEVQMSPSYEMTVRQQAQLAEELNSRCQDGDEQACQEGLAVCSETLNLIVDGIDGKANYED